MVSRNGIELAGSALGCLIPLENLTPVPVQHALESSGVFIDCFEVFDSGWLAEWSGSAPRTGSQASRDRDL